MKAIDVASNGGTAAKNAGATPAGRVARRPG